MAIKSIAHPVVGFFLPLDPLLIFALFPSTIHSQNKMTNAMPGSLSPISPTAKPLV